MRTIYKYLVNLYGDTVMPEGAILRHIGVQDNAIHVWAEVDTNVPNTRPYKLRVYGTGHPLPDNPLMPQGVYLGSVHMHQDQLIFHVYEELV